MRVLHLTPLMAMGHGVAEVIAAISAEWAREGIFVAAGCQGTDNHFRQLSNHIVPPSPEAVSDLATSLGCNVIIAHGSPYFEVLPALTGRFRTIAYEHGDPTPEFFTHDAAERRAIVDRKRLTVYPSVSGVVAISEFIREDIGWPAAFVIRSGVDHIPDLGTKMLITEQPSKPLPLRVGTLMRLGAGEAKYKGPHLLSEIRATVMREDPTVQFEAMGRGTPADAEGLREQGILVHLNATDEERTAYLRNLDVFVSPSLWEGMNLPLVEAQALATPALAFDTGAHPEFSPLVFDSIDALSQQIVTYGANRALLNEHGKMCYHFVRDGLTWRSTATNLADYLRAQPGRPGGRVAQRQPLTPRIRRRLGRYKAAALNRTRALRDRRAAG